MVRFFQRGDPERGAMWDRGWSGRRSFQHVSETFFFIIFLRYMGIYTVMRASFLRRQIAMYVLIKFAEEIL
jgi:hypothetical protein